MLSVQQEGGSKLIPVYKVGENGNLELVEELPFEKILERGENGEISFINYNGKGIYVLTPRSSGFVSRVRNREVVHRRRFRRNRPVEQTEVEVIPRNTGFVDRIKTRERVNRERLRRFFRPLVEEVPPKEKVKEDEIIDVNPLPSQRLSIKRSPFEQVDEDIDESVNTITAPSTYDIIRERFRYVFEPLVSNSTYTETDTKRKFKPRFASKQRYLIKPNDINKYYDDYNYEPTLVQITAEDYAPRDRGNLLYNPQVVQEAYPVYNYSSYGIPDTLIDEYSPQESVKIKPVTEFEIHAKPTPLIVSQAQLLLLNKLMSGVLR